MPRPARIEYECAVHHVMNRGRARHKIFHGEAYFEIFLQTLQEASEQFDAVIHAYCLMGNHYHLIVETPNANLSRIMRYVNGVYTQRYNRLRKTDGSLFRGRYKSILIDEDAYLLQLSRYIHRNPIETQKPMVNNLEDYRWSSYPAYVNKVAAVDWLHREKTYQMLGHRKKYLGYRDYVMEGIDEDILRYYSKGNILSVLGDKEFRESVREETKDVDLEVLRQVLQDKPSASMLIALVAKVFSVDVASITEKPTGRLVSNPARAYAMYCCQQYGAMSLKKIGQQFGLGNSGSASFSIAKIRKEIAQGQWKKVTKLVESDLYIIK